jgi:Protein of unknown function (DUF3987)
VGDSGTHKTPALSAATTILRRKQDEALADFESRLACYETAALKYEADLAAWKRAKAETRGEPPEKPEEPIAQRYIVSDVTVEALADWFGAEGRRVYGVLAESDEERDRRQLVELIEQLGDGITANELRRRSRRFASSEDAEAALNELASRGIGRWDRTSSTAQGGRPTRRFRLANAVSVSDTPFNHSEIEGLGYSGNFHKDIDDINRAFAEAGRNDFGEF